MRGRLILRVVVALALYVGGGLAALWLLPDGGPIRPTVQLCLSLVLVVYLVGLARGGKTAAHSSR
jgi:hypothetical protein